MGSRGKCNRQPLTGFGPPEVDQAQFETIMYSVSQRKIDVFTPFIKDFSQFRLTKGLKSITCSRGKYDKHLPTDLSSPDVNQINMYSFSQRKIDVFSPFIKNFSQCRLPQGLKSISCSRGKYDQQLLTDLDHPDVDQA